ncbi:hypothetical protein GEV33_002518 [Tenebrio molitor]|uniref:Uncharacterized protein n=1 Tax=Tenebrio molitor TaxID=7067 RepID=A0A8J6HU65_TENMO|nr:hypothetical protein GEV33_002518 [Tenebrio molitor]
MYDGGLLYTGYRYRDCGASSWYHGVHVQGAEPIESAGPGDGYVAGWTVFPVDTRTLASVAANLCCTSGDRRRRCRRSKSQSKCPSRVIHCWNIWMTMASFSRGAASLQRDGLLLAIVFGLVE